MTAATLSYADLLQAARCPGTSNVYFIGPFTPRITFFSQQVRALQLARAMDALAQIKPKERVAVVGAGAAGVTMAVALALLGQDVTLYDRADEILQLQSGSLRLLHPHIYEWPRLGSLNDRAGLPVLDWSAGTGSSVCKAMRAEFKILLSALPNLIFKGRHTLAGLVQSGPEWELELDTPDGRDPRYFNHVVLAMGFGDEIPCGSVTPEDYWKPGAIGTTATETVTGVSYVVSGNGDGALTVMLGLLVKDFEHDAFTREFLNFFTHDQLRTAAEAAFAGATFESDVECQIRAQVMPVLTKYGVLDKLRTRLRKDRVVTLNANGPLFAAGKASQLNQCMVLAVLEAALLEAVPITRTTGFVSACQQTTKGIVLTGTQVAGIPDTTAYKHAILRHGPNVAERYKPTGLLIEQYKTHVASLLAQNSVFRTPPALDNATFDLFEDKRISRLFGITAQAQQRALAEQSRQVIEFVIDPATHVLVERGCQRVADIALQCEQLPCRYTIDLHVAPEAFPAAADLIRLARCSAGKIELCAGSEVASAWKLQFAGTIDARPASSVRPVAAYKPAAIADCVDAALVRLLDTRIQTVIAAGGAAPLGMISPAILCHVRTTWSRWRLTLDGDPTLRFDFLRWLSNVDQQVNQPWDGDHAALPRMANALIMIAAAHLGEPLTPSSIAIGNLWFATNAVALGTGCEAIGAQPLSTRSMPDDWGVDALILSAASDVIVEDPIGTVINAGDTGGTINTARRVRPAIIQNDKKWRERLGGSLQDWQDAVKKEFAAWRQRQDDEVNRVSG